MQKISGYIRVLARTRAEQEQNKPLFGKPYLKFGQCHNLWSYFFQLGGVLGAKHSKNLDVFATAFLGISGPSGAAEQFFKQVSKHMLENSLKDTITCIEYVGKEFMGRIGYKRSEDNFISEYGMQKIDIKTSEELAWQYAEQGTALGAFHPAILRRMVEQTHKLFPKEMWETAVKAGLDISLKQTQLTYEEIENLEDAVFMAYCQKCCPDYYAILRV